MREQASELSTIDGSKVLIYLVAGIVILFIGVWILRASCALFNRCFAGSKAKHGVPVPGIGKAALITLMSIIAGQMTALVLSIILPANLQSAVAIGSAPINLSRVIDFPLELTVSALILEAMLPTSLKRGLAISLLQMVVAIVVGVVVCFVGAAIFLLVRRGV